jgi:hypothetical protein
MAPIIPRWCRSLDGSDEPRQDDPGENELPLEQQEGAESVHGREEEQEIHAFPKKKLPIEANSCSMTPI